LKKAVDTFSNYLKSTKVVEAALSECLHDAKADCTQPMAGFEQKLAGVESTWNGLISVAELESAAK
jgi:hypothetical protein